MSIDVGAADGTYVAHLMLYSSRVIAFEPRKDAAEALRSRFRNVKLVSVEEVALSDSAASVLMHVPVGVPMLGTIEPSNQLRALLRPR
jgi:FkbM family methyltransferase